MLQIVKPNTFTIEALPHGPFFSPDILTVNKIGTAFVVNPQIQRSFAEPKKLFTSQRLTPRNAITSFDCAKKPFLCKFFRCKLFILPRRHEYRPFTPINTIVWKFDSAHVLDGENSIYKGCSGFQFRFQTSFLGVRFRSESSSPRLLRL